MCSSPGLTESETTQSGKDSDSVNLYASSAFPYIISSAAIVVFTAAALGVITWKMEFFVTLLFFNPYFMTYHLIIFVTMQFFVTLLFINPYFMTYHLIFFAALGVITWKMEFCYSSIY